MAIRSAPSRPSTPAPAASLIGKGWAQGVALVMIFGFLVMGILVYRTYTASMPLPANVVSESGKVLFSGAQITRGQELYQARGLMQYGSVLGHGAYLGPDYTAEYLRMSTNDVAAQWRAQGLLTRRNGWWPSFAPTATTPTPRRWCSPISRRPPSTISNSITRITSARTPPSTGCCRT